MLQNAYFLAKIGADTAENEQHFAEILPKTGNYPTGPTARSAPQFQKYLVNTDNSGMTLMWHGLSTKYRVDPHLISIIEDIDAQGVAYLYLPLYHWEKKKIRNKGYAFVHLKTAADAEEFTRKVWKYTVESRRSTPTTLAAHQGISLNLTQLVTAPQKSTVAGAIYLPNAEGKFECVTIPSLRKLYKQMGNGK